MQFVRKNDLSQLRQLTIDLLKNYVVGDKKKNLIDKLPTYQEGKFNTVKWMDFLDQFIDDEYQKKMKY